MVDLMIHQLQTHQFLTLFLTLGLGFAIGKVKIGKFQLGGVAGSLLFAVLIGQVGGISISPDVQNMFFALFIFMVGYNGGPQFFASLNRSALTMLIATVSMTVLGLISVVVISKMAGLDMGLAAGLASGGLTQSAIIGTAGNAIDNLGLSAALAEQYKTNVAVGYSVTYIFGSLGPILIITIIPILYGWDIRAEAKKLATKLSGGAPILDEGQFLAVNRIQTRAFSLDESAKCLHKSVKDFESSTNSDLIIEEILREGKSIDYNEKMILELKDTIIVSGLVAVFSKHHDDMGVETADINLSQNLIEEQRDVVVTSGRLNNYSLQDIHDKTNPEQRHGVFISNVKRMGHSLGAFQNTIIKLGDEVTLIGTTADVSRAAKRIGYNTPLPSVTDFTALGIGMVIGYIIGEISFNIDGTKVALGSGLGCLVSGLLVGYLRVRTPKFGSINHGAANFLQTFGLAVFVSVVGLNAAEPALKAIQEYGVTLLLLGVLVTLIPQILQFPINYYILKIKNPVEAMAVIAGSRSGNPAFSTLLDQTENSTPVASFTVTYALANILLTLWGPIIIAIMYKG